MKAFTVFILVALAFAGLATDLPCPGQPNTEPLINQEPKFVSQVTNGKRYVIENGTNIINIGLFQGSAYEAGKAYGQLFAEEIKENLNNMVDYYDSMAKDYIRENLPVYLRWLADLPLRVIFNDVLALEYLDTFFFTPERFEKEMKGMADGSGVSESWIKHINLLPELIKAQCTIAGAWGEATAGNATLQLRALDWDASAPMSKHPLVSVYHFDIEGSQTFANFGWAGIIGSLAGFSPKVGIAEKVWLPIHNNDTTRYGMPWMYVLRDVLQFGTDLATGLKIMSVADRTW
mmetsp:Transcript_27006/g.23893  ORF Transcript_27006/g.23893 Transcript_27006/m.23893 type:complete len:290 (-) Transcript_27006:537-1406(-)